MVRKLTKDDLDDFYQIRLEALERVPTAFGRSYDEEKAGGSGWFDTILTEDRDTSVLFGAFQGAKIVGTIGIVASKGIKRCHHAMIWGMYVRPEFQGRSFGKNLLLTAINHARTKMNARVVGLSVESTNVSAKRLYMSCGFQSWGQEPLVLRVKDRYYVEDHMYLDSELT